MGTIDSIQFFGNTFNFNYEFSATPSLNVAVKQPDKIRLTLLNINGKADTTEFKKVLRSVRATFDANDFLSSFGFSVWINTLDLGQEHCDIERECRVIVRKKEPLPVVADTLLCGDAKPILLNNLLENPNDTFGVWQPKTNKKSVFSPNIDKKGIFYYIIPQIDECPADTLRTKIDVLDLPKNVLGRDTIVCKDSLFALDVSRYGFDNFTWNDGSKTPFNLLTQEGKYWISMTKKHCAVSDTVQITNVNCKRCDFYIPNTFSPNDDGVNDVFEVFSSCEKIQTFDLQVFDRWGNLIFQSDDREKTWNGTYKGIVANPGVYSYWLKTITEYKNKPFETLKKGDLMLMH
jgi:gliding motility-associated-like protein